MKFVNSEAEVMKFSNEDVIRTSGACQHGNTKAVDNINSNDPNWEKHEEKHNG